MQMRNRFKSREKHAYVRFSLFACGLCGIRVRKENAKKNKKDKVDKGGAEKGH